MTIKKPKNKQEINKEINAKSVEKSDRPSRGWIMDAYKTDKNGVRVKITNGHYIEEEPVSKSSQENKANNKIGLGCCGGLILVLIVGIISSCSNNSKDSSTNDNKPVQIETTKNESSSSQSTSSKTDNSSRYTPGRETTLKNMGLLFMGTSEDNWNKLLKYIQANDSVGVAQMVYNGEALKVDGGSKIKVIEANVHFTTGEIDHIRILEGQNSLSEGWISGTFVE